tara:strand:- start:1937 stop:2461 length:525 start_codon:yes stop_codon:yes gene_type:complete
MKNIVRINIDSKMNDLELTIDNRSIVNILNKNHNNKGSTNIRHLYSWIHNKNTIKCFGWYEGKEEYINKHELIHNGSSKFLDEDSSTILLYGDIFLICYDEKNVIKNFTVADYAEYYDIMNEGLDDCLSDDSEDSEPDEEIPDEDYDENDSEEEHGFEIVNSDDSELETDENTY